MRNLNLHTAQSLAVAGMILALATGCSNQSSAQEEASFASAIETCREIFPKPFRESQLNPPWTLDEDGKGMFIDGVNGAGEGLPVEAAACLLTALEIPDSVLARMDKTSALMGQQEAEWGQFRALWNFHPGSGLDITLNLKEQSE